MGNLADHFNYDDGAGNGIGLYDASEVGRGASSDEGVTISLALHV